MSSISYWDRARSRPVQPARDGIALAEWTTDSDAPCALHPKGFPIFLPADRIGDSDEYAEADPYSVEAESSGPFQQRRVECTLELVASACATLDGPIRILDLGCGEGHITHDIRLAHRDALIAGFDYSVSAISRAVELFEDIEFAVADAYACPYPDEHFDIVVCNNVWEHVPDPLNLLGSITRVLKPGGHVVISTPSRYNLWNLLKVIRGREVAFMSRHHVTEYTIGQVREQLRFGGFEVVRTTSRPTAIGDLKSRIANVMLEKFIRAVGSHHRLELTVFYLARKEATRSDPGSRPSSEHLRSTTHPPAGPAG